MIFLDGKQMIEYLETELTRAPKKLQILTMRIQLKRKNVDESTTAEAKATNKTENYHKEEQTTETCKEKMNIDIENIHTIEKRHKVYTQLWRDIYEVIQQNVLEKTDIFPEDFMKKCKNIANQAQFLPVKEKMT